MCVDLLREDKHAPSDRWWNARTCPFGVANACERLPLFTAVQVQRGNLSRAPLLQLELRNRAVEYRQLVGQHPEQAEELSPFATGLHSNMRGREECRPTLVTRSSSEMSAVGVGSFKTKTKMWRETR
jgi:hypothetical protein